MLQFNHRKISNGLIALMGRLPAPFRREHLVFCWCLSFYLGEVRTTMESLLFLAIPPRRIVRGWRLISLVCINLQLGERLERKLFMPNVKVSIASSKTILKE